MQQRLDAFEGKDNLDQARVMIEERTLGNGAEALAKLLQLGISFGGAATVRGVEPAKRADTVDSARVALGSEIGSFQIGGAEAGFANELRVILGGDSVLNNVAVRAAETEQAVIKLQIPGGVDQAGIHGRERTKMLHLFFLVVDRRLEETQSALGYSHRGGPGCQNVIPRENRERGTDTAWDDPGTVHTFLSKAFDKLQAKFTQFNAVASHFRIPGNDAEDIAGCRIGIHAEQKVGRGEVEEAERMRLHDLRKMNQLAKLPPGGGNAHSHDRVTGL